MKDEIKYEIERIFELDDPIKSFEGLILISKKDLVLVNDLLKNEYPNVHFINWSDENNNILNKNAELKYEIYQKLVANMLRDNHLTIDLTNCEIDEQFLKCLADALETNHYIGALLLAQHDENRFYANINRHRISKILDRNNDNFSRFPSDYIHCLLASHCYTNRDKTLEKKMNNLGWKVEEELSLILKEEKKGDKSNMYLSRLYKNDSTRQLVLAFRGIKLNVDDFFSTNQLDSLVLGTLANEVTSYSYYAYQHCKSAHEMSESLKYNLSFTGYSFGAWLAEQSVSFCYKIFETRNVRAVTFESPGSWEITQELAGSHIHNRVTDKNELGKLLDIKTFLFSPNFINTSKEHIGRVFEMSLIKGDVDSDSVEVWDDFIMNKFISKIPSNPLKKLFENWYLKIVKVNLIVKKNGMKKISPKYLFYLNGIRAIFSDDIKWLLKEFENDKIELKEVTRWPKMDFRPKSDKFNELNLSSAIIPIIGSIIPKNLMSILSKPIDLALNRIINEVIKSCFSSMAIVYNIISEIPFGGLNDAQFHICFENDLVILNDEIVLGKEGFDLVYGGCYEIKTYNRFKDKLYAFDPTHLDYQIMAYFYDKTKISNQKLTDKFRKLETKLEIQTKRDGEFTVFHLLSKDENVSVEKIRERFLRLYEINEVYDRKYTKNIKKLVKSKGEEHRLNVMKNRSFVKEDENIFKKIDQILNNSQYCWIYGQSGYGKSTLAFEYGYYIKEFSNDYFVHLIASGDKIENINELAMRFLNTEENKKADKIVLLEKIRLKIRSFERKILFIFDNLDTFESIELILNILNEHKFLITTKNHSLFQSNKNGIELNGYNLNWCIEYLKISGINFEKDSEKWIELIHRFSNEKMPPQSLLNLINYIKVKKSLNFEDYELFLNLDLSNKCEVIKKEDKLAFYILQHLAFIDGTGIDLTIIIEMFKNKIGFETSLKYLVNYGHLKEEIWREKITIIIRESIRKEIEKNSEKSEFEAIRLNIIENFKLIIEKEFETDIEIAKWDEKKMEKIKELEKHGYKIFKKYKDLKEKLVLLLKKLLNINSEIFINYIKVEEIEKYILEIQIEKYSENHPNIATSYNNIGNILDKQGKYLEALEYYEKSLRIRKETLATNNPNIATSYNDIGNVLDKQGKYSEAIEHYEKCLYIWKKSLSANHPRIALLYNNIGNVLYKQNKFMEAIDYYGKCLKIWKKSLSSKNILIATLYNNIGSVLNKQGRYSEALDYYENCLNIRKESLSANHPSIATSYNNIGYVLNKEGKYPEALEYYEKSLRIRKDILPTNHPNVATSYNNIGYVLNKEGKYSEALEYYEKSLNIQKESLPTNHPLVATLCNNIGNVLYKQNKYIESLEYYENCLNIQKESLSTNHPDIATSYNNIGNVLSNQGKYDEAQEYYEKCLKIRKKILPEDHPHIATSYNNIATVLNFQKKYEVAFDYINRSLKIRQEKLPKNHPDIATSLCCIGNFLEHQGKHSEALEYYEKSLKIRKETLPENHPDIQSLITNIIRINSKINSNKKSVSCILI